MQDWIASSYYQPQPKKNSFANRTNLLTQINYWRLIPFLKLVNRKRYRKAAILLLKVGLIQISRRGVPIRYQIKQGVASFDISPDQGRSYLNYLRGNIISASENEIYDIIHAIATVEAIIKSKRYVIY